MALSSNEQSRINPAPVRGLERCQQAAQAQRGSQQRPTKAPLTVRYDHEVVAYFKSTGAGWQTRMNEVLYEWVANQGPA